MTLLIDHCRDVIGLPMRGLAHGSHIGWTTDGAKAKAASEAGARCTYVRAQSSARECDGWEIVFGVGREYQPRAE